MGILKVLIAISMLYLVAGDDGMIIGPTGQSTSPSNGTTAISPNKATTSTAQPLSTTTSATTTSTSKPTTSTTTSKPTTTTATSKPTTSTTTTSTTSKPTTTTVKPTTPAPVDPVQGEWSVNDTTKNVTCLILKAALQIDISYKDGNTTETYKINVPPTATAAGECRAETEMITLNFVQLNNTITFSFGKTNDTKKFNLTSVIVTVNVTTADKNSSQLVMLVHDKQEFATPLSNSYKCAKEQILNLTGTVPDTKGQLRISQLQMQAFHNSDNTKFDEALDCAGSETPDVVPIAVGCALAALVIIVLIAYLIGRRRSQARGYLSM